MVIKYGLICGGVIWVAFFLIVVSLGLESPSCVHQHLPQAWSLSLVLVHRRDFTEALLSGLVSWVHAPFLF